MDNDSVPPARLGGDRNSLPQGQQAREIIIPRDPAAGPVTAVRMVLLQSSLNQLRSHGYFERYQSFVDQDVLALLTSEIAPGWVPVDVARAHYDACDNLLLSPEQVVAIGSDVGGHLSDAVVVSPAKKSRDSDFDIWAALGPIHRLWARVYQGGSVKVVKLGPKEQLLESFGFSLDRSHYFRYGKLAAIAQVYAGFGLQISSVKFVSYSAARDESVIRVTWL
jgi:hypothetical protein